MLSLLDSNWLPSSKVLIRTRYLTQTYAVDANNMLSISLGTTALLLLSISKNYAVAWGKTSAGWFLYTDGMRLVRWTQDAVDLPWLYHHVIEITQSLDGPWARGWNKTCQAFLTPQPTRSAGNETIPVPPVRLRSVKSQHIPAMALTDTKWLVCRRLRLCMYIVPTHEVGKGFCVAWCATPPSGTFGFCGVATMFS